MIAEPTLTLTDLMARAEQALAEHKAKSAAEEEARRRAELARYDAEWREAEAFLATVLPDALMPYVMREYFDIDPDPHGPADDQHFYLVLDNCMPVKLHIVWGGYPEKTWSLGEWYPKYSRGNYFMVAGWRETDDEEGNPVARESFGGENNPMNIFLTGDLDLAIGCARDRYPQYQEFCDRTEEKVNRRKLQDAPPAAPEYYRLLEFGTASYLAEQINQAIAQGWRLHGATQVTFTADGTWYAQALVR